MKVVISVVRPFHSSLLANTVLQDDNHSVTLYTSAPRRFFKTLSGEVQTRFVPSIGSIAGHLLKMPMPTALMQASDSLYDVSVASIMGSPDIYIGWASHSLRSGVASKRRGGRYILDRACPHTDFQQQLLREESELTGTKYEPQPGWFYERLLREYEEADTILVPSNYSGRTFPVHQQSKVVKAPLIGRGTIKDLPTRKRSETFTLGILGGEPRRKGYIYLLRAWKKLALPNARLLIRSSADFSEHPVLAELIAELSNTVEIVRYVPNIDEFYQRCDAFVLSSVDDGFGMALFEAMANGLPCISTRNCGASELVNDGEEGIVIDARSEEQLASAILRLYQDEDLRRTLAENGRQKAIHITSGEGNRMYTQAIHSVLHATPTKSVPLPVSASQY